MRLRLETANEIASKAMEEGSRAGMSPLTVAVLDPGGHVLALQRHEDSEFLRVDIAIGKAWASLSMGVPGRTLGERGQQAPAFFNSLSVASRGRFVPGPGGVIIRDEEGAIVGAVGVSGDSGDADEEAAKAGIAAVGLLSDYGQEPGWLR